MALKRGRKPAAKKPPEEKCYCRRCRRTIAGANFYAATNKFIDTNDKMSICKDCCTDIYNWFYKIHKTVDTALFYTCQEIDLRYEPEIVEATKTRIASIQEKGNDAEAVVGYYKSNLSSTGKDNFGYTEFQFKDSSVLKLSGEKAPVQYNPDEYESIEISYLRNRWGNMQIDELQWLEQKWEEWAQGFEIDSKNRTLIVEQIVFEEFYIFQERSQGKDVSKRLKNIKDLMSMGNLQPKQESASETAEFNSFPVMIAHVEQNRPCYVENHQLKDVDDMEKNMKILEGLIARSAGNPNPNTNIFEKEYTPETMDLSAISGGE